MPVTFGPGGNSDSFSNDKLKFPTELVGYLKKHGLNGYEIECGRGLNIGKAVYENLPKIAEDGGIYVTLHAPYYISVSGENEETRQKSVNYIYESALAAHKLGIKKIVVHSGSCAKMTREQAMLLAKDTFKKAQEKLDGEGLSEIIICPETMGKINQLGTLSEVLELCAVNERFLPCIDFGHLNARTLGGIKGYSDYEAVFDEAEKILGFDRTSNMHMHFSKIEFSAGGEKRHLTFEGNICGGDTCGGTTFGPDFEPLMEIIARRKYEPSIICESAGTQAEDCAVMKKYYDSVLADRED